MRRAILLPTNKNSPQWTWVPYTDGTDIDHEAIVSRLGKDNPAIDLRVIQYNSVLGRDTQHTIYIWFRDAYLVDGSTMNRSVLAATLGLRPLRWSGAVLVCGGKGCDIDLTDYKHVLDFLSVYDVQGKQEERMLWASRSIDRGLDPRPTGLQEGIRANCLGDQQVLGLPAFQRVLVPKRHPQGSLNRDNTPTLQDLQVSMTGGNPSRNTSGTVPALSTLLKMPLSVWKIDSVEAWVNRSTSSNDLFRNEATVSLLHHVELQPSSKTKTRRDKCACGCGQRVPCGCFPNGWFHRVGSVFAVRQDGKPLLKEHVDALVAFYKRKLAPLCACCTAKDEHDTARLSAETTPEKFRRFFEEYREAKGLLDPRWNTVPSPYEV